MTCCGWLTYNRVHAFVQAALIHGRQVLLRNRLEAHEDGAAAALPHQPQEIVVSGDVDRPLAGPVEVEGFQGGEERPGVLPVGDDVVVGEEYGLPLETVAPLPYVPELQENLVDALAPQLPPVVGGNGAELAVEGAPLRSLNDIGEIFLP